MLPRRQAVRLLSEKNLLEVSTLRPQRRYKLTYVFVSLCGRLSTTSL